MTTALQKKQPSLPVYQQNTCSNWEIKYRCSLTNNDESNTDNDSVCRQGLLLGDYADMDLFPGAVLGSV